MSASYNYTTFLQDFLPDVNSAVSVQLQKLWTTTNLKKDETEASNMYFQELNFWVLK